MPAAPRATPRSLQCSGPRPPLKLLLCRCLGYVCGRSNLRRLASSLIVYRSHTTFVDIWSWVFLLFRLWRRIAFSIIRRHCSHQLRLGHHAWSSDSYVVTSVSDSVYLRILGLYLGANNRVETAGVWERLVMQSTSDIHLRQQNKLTPQRFSLHPSIAGFWQASCSSIACAYMHR